MRINTRFWSSILFGAVMMTPFAISPVALQAQDHHDARTFHDKENNDEHHWDSHEDKAYRMWAKENHRKYNSFAKLKEEDQQSYWAWRHHHSDADLKIEIKH